MVVGVSWRTWRGTKVRGLPDGSGRRPFAQESSPGVEGGFGEPVAAAEGAHGQAAASPEFKELSPVLCFAGIGWVALWHEQNLQDRVKEDHVLKVTAETRMGPTGRLRCSTARHRSR